MFAAAQLLAAKQLLSYGSTRSPRDYYYAIAAGLLGGQELLQAVLWAILDDDTGVAEVDPQCSAANVVASAWITLLVWLVPVANALLYRYGNTASAAKLDAGNAWFTAVLAVSVAVWCCRMLWFLVPGWEAEHCTTVGRHGHQIWPAPDIGLERDVFTVAYFAPGPVLLCQYASMLVCRLVHVTECAQYLMLGAWLAPGQALVKETNIVKFTRPCTAPPPLQGWAGGISIRSACLWLLRRLDRRLPLTSGQRSGQRASLHQSGAGVQARL